MRRTIGDEIEPAEALFPVTAVPGTRIPSPLPVSNLERVYFKFGAPVDTAPLDERDRGACSAAYKRCKCDVEALIAELLAYREGDPDRDGAARLRGQLSQGVRASLRSLRSPL